MTAQFLNGVQLTNLSADPSGWATGSAYFNTALGCIRLYNGTSWVNSTAINGTPSYKYPQNNIRSGSPRMNHTFIQPGTGSNPTSNLTWTQTRWNQELAAMQASGISNCMLQWCADIDPSSTRTPTAYYPSGTISNNSAQILTYIKTAAAALTSNPITVWTGLATYNGLGAGADNNDYYNFYTCCNGGTGTGSVGFSTTTSTFYTTAATNTFLSFQETVASQLYSIYGTSGLGGFYIPEEMDGNYSLGGTAQTNAATYYQSLISYIHTNCPGMPVMVSPFFSNPTLLQTPAQWAAILVATFLPANVAARPDILALQIGVGDTAAVTTNIAAEYFAAVSKAFAGSGVQLWGNTDMYYDPTGGGPISIADLTGSMQAVAPYVQDMTGFSFTSQMSPIGLGTNYWQNAYNASILSPATQTGIWSPAAPSLYTAETIPRVLATSAVAPSKSSIPYGSLVYLSEGVTISNIKFVTNSTASSGTVSDGWYALCTSSGTVLGVTANNTTAWTANTDYTLALTSSVLIPYSGYYYVVFCCTVATTAPTFYGAASPASGSSVLLGQSPMISCTWASQAAPPSVSGTLTSQTAVATAPMYGAVS